MEEDFWHQGIPKTREASAVGIDFGWANDRFTTFALAKNVPFYKCVPEVQMALKGKEEVEAFIKEAEKEFEVRMFMMVLDEKSYDTIQFYSDETVINVATYYESQYTLNVMSFNREIVDRAVKFVQKYREKTNKSKLKILVDDDGSMRFRDVASQAKPLERGNYTDEVLEALDHAAEDLENPDPCGRIVLLGGPPGSGKTTAVRSFPGMAKSACFVVVPSVLIGQLASPTFLGLLLRNKPDTGAIVLIIEDADEAIAERGQGNEAVLSTVLNMSDGILGAALDIRIVATTNAKVQELDNAVLRPGRLCRRIEIGSLPASKANEIYSRIKSGAEGPFAEGRYVTLAEVYAEASGKKTSPVLKRATGKLGFGAKG